MLLNPLIFRRALDQNVTEIRGLQRLTEFYLVLIFWILFKIYFHYFQEIQQDIKFWKIRPTFSENLSNSSSDDSSWVHEFIAFGWWTSSMPSEVVSVLVAANYMPLLLEGAVRRVFSLHRRWLRTRTWYNVVYRRTKWTVNMVER